jgi:CelD/BcsL family acetyltransferase involved in cellulose biosynthesis
MPPVDAALRRIDVEAAPVPRDRAIARIDVFDDIAAAAPDWDRLAEGAVATPFGRRDWIDLWQRHVGERSAVRPMIAVARDAGGEPLFLLPLARRVRRLVTIAHYFGGRHSQLNMGLWRPDVAAAITSVDLAGALETIARQRDVDLFLLLNQPVMWDGRRNPLAQLAHQPSPDNVFSVDFGGLRGDEAVKSRLSPALRGILKSKEKKLARLAGYRYFRAAGRRGIPARRLHRDARRAQTARARDRAARDRGRRRGARRDGRGGEPAALFLHVQLLHAR